MLKSAEIHHALSKLAFKGSFEQALAVVFGAFLKKSFDWQRQNERNHLKACH